MFWYKISRFIGHDNLLGRDSSEAYDIISDVIRRRDHNRRLPSSPFDHMPINYLLQFEHQWIFGRVVKAHRRQVVNRGYHLALVTNWLLYHAEVHQIGLQSIKLFAESGLLIESEFLVRAGYFGETRITKRMDLHIGRLQQNSVIMLAVQFLQLLQQTEHVST